MLKCVLCLCIISCVLGSFVITGPPSLASSTSYPSLGYVFEGLQSDWMVNGTLVLTEPNSPCENLRNADALKGNIAVTLIGGCISGDQARTVKAAGAIGLAVVSTVRNNFPSGLKDGNPSGLDDFPMADLIILDDTAFMAALNKKDGPPVTGVITPDPNYLHNWGDWGPFIGIFLLFSVVNISIASWKLYLFLQHYGPRLILSQIILSVEIFANLVEPINGGFGVFNIQWHTVAFTFSWPYSYISTFMIAFYWEEMLNKFSKKGGLSKEAYPSLQKMRIPAIVVSAFLIFLEHLFAALRAVYVTNVSFTVYVMDVIYLILAVILGLYFSITGVRVVRLLKRTVTKQTRKSRLITRMSLLLCISGFGILLHVLGNILVEATFTKATPPVVTLSFGLLFGGLYVASLTQILSFATPREKKKSTSGTSQSTEGTSSKSSASKAETEMEEESKVEMTSSQVPEVEIEVTKE